MARPQQISTDALLAMLAAHRGTTAGELAERLGMGQSTASKQLAALELAGKVERTPGGRDAGRRLPDRWSVPAPLPEPIAALPQPESSAPDAGEPTTEEPDAPEPGPSGPVAAEPTTTGPAAAATDSADDASGAAAARLKKGALGDLVREHLAARPGEPLGPAEVGKALGRSQGAVSNALVRLVTNGEAELVSESPRRYRIVAA